MWRHDWEADATAQQMSKQDASLAAASADAQRYSEQVQQAQAELSAARSALGKAQALQREAEDKMQQLRESSRLDVAQQAKKASVLEEQLARTLADFDEERTSLQVSLVEAQKAATDANARAAADRAAADAARHTAENTARFEELVAEEVSKRQEAEDRAHRVAVDAKEQVALQNVALVEARKAATDAMHRVTVEKSELEAARSAFAELEVKFNSAREAEYAQAQNANRALSRLHEYQEEAEAKLNNLLLAHREQLQAENTRITEDYERRLAELRMQLALKSTAPPPPSVPERPPPVAFRVDMSKSVTWNLNALIKEKKMHAIDLFRQLDVGNDGYISKEDWRAGLTMLGFHLSDERSDQMFDEADFDKSGGLEYAEFERYLSGKTPPSPPPPVRVASPKPTPSPPPAKKTPKPPQPHKGRTEADKNARLLAAMASSMGVRQNLTWYNEAESVAPGSKKHEEAFEDVMKQRAESFGHADLNKDGKLDLEEYCAMVKFRETTNYTEKQLRQKFAEMDADSSGTIELHEFIVFSLRDAVKRSKGKAIDIFSIWDNDKSGYIDLTEFGKALVALGFVCSRQDIEKCFKMLDEDGSGQIEYKELAKMLRRMGSESSGSPASK